MAFGINIFRPGLVFYQLRQNLLFQSIELKSQFLKPRSDAGVVEFRVIAMGEVGFNRVLLTELEYFVAQTSRPYTIRFNPPLSLQPKWDFKIQAKKDSGGGAVRIAGDFLTTQVDIS